MTLSSLRSWLHSRTAAPRQLIIGGVSVPLLCVRNPRARRYIVRVTRDGHVRATVPRNGSVEAAVAFATKCSAWVERQLERRKAESQPRPWGDGTEILYRGESVRLEVEASDQARVVRWADQTLRVAGSSGDLRPAVEHLLRCLAGIELPMRTRELAALHQLEVGRVVVRNQRTRWGSCSRKRTISLNWRLIQAPASVRDYLIIHELMHLREMNHSDRFWRLVAAADPGYESAERWLNAHGHLLRGR